MKRYNVLLQHVIVDALSEEDAIEKVNRALNNIPSMSYDDDIILKNILVDFADLIGDAGDF